MRVGTFVLVTAAGMAATSAFVWSATSPAPSSPPPRTASSERAEPSPAEPKDEPEDRSTFQAGGTLMMEGRLGHAVLPAATDTETYLYVDVEAQADARAAEPAPLDLSIVIDRSGSMRGARLENAIDAARTALERLRPGDAVSVVSYDTRTRILVPRTVVTPEARSRVLRRLERVRVGGDTCISCGIRAGMRQLGGQSGERVQRILLLSDGKATAGVRDAAGFRRIAESCRRMGASVTTIGVDVDYNEQIMSAIARESNGRHFFVRDASGLPAIFDEEMASLEKTVANGTEVVVDLAPGVFVSEVFDRSFTRGQNRVEVPLGAFAAGDEKTLLLRLRVPRGPAGERPVAAVRLDYDDLVKDEEASCTGDLVARVSSDPSDVAPLDGLVSARITQSETAEALEKANELARSGRVSAARELLDRQRDRVRQRRRKAKKSLDPAARPRADRRFDFSSGTLSGAGKGYGRGAEDAEAQIRKNTADAFQGTL